MGSLGVPIHPLHARDGVSVMRRARARLRRRLAIWLATATAANAV